MVNVTYPGVYIDEISTGGPIAGVGTSTAAFIGPAMGGPYFKPTRVTNWAEFQKVFGGYMPGTYLAHAVRGFFDNGGTIAYIVRVGTGVRASSELADRGTRPGKALRVEAKLEGAAGNNIALSVADAEIAKANVHRQRVATAKADAQVITLADAADAAKFRVGDVVTVEGTDFRGAIKKIERETLILDAPLAQAQAAGFVRLADLAPGQTSFRLDSTNGFEPGSVIKIPKGRSSETQIISGIAGNFITLAGNGLKNAYELAPDKPDVPVSTLEFALKVTGPNTGDAPETFANLSMDGRHSRYWGSVVKSRYVDVMEPAIPTAQQPPNNLPAVVDGVALNPASDGDPVGLKEYERGIDALVPVLDVQLVCAPDGVTQDIQQALVKHCEELGDRFAILDPAAGLPPDDRLLEQRKWCESKKGYASLYYPWLVITDPLTGKGRIKIPPSGHVAGIFARSDAQRGVHKAPANELITGALGLDTIVDNTQNGILNGEGINVLRVFPGEVRPIVWGARTTSDGTEWMHNSVRRLFIFVETSLKQGLRPWVFEPNNTGLWKKIDRTITEFLTRVWRSGALFGEKASDAFYVKIDEELNPPALRALGQVIVEVGMAPVHPAEFIIVRIGIWEGGVSISEG